ncbi:MAG: hypothetical protein ABEJ73_12875 [Haloplanus sp.]
MSTPTSSSASRGHTPGGPSRRRPSGRRARRRRGQEEGLPSNPEFAIGAASDGSAGIDDYLEANRERAAETARE